MSSVSPEVLTTLKIALLQNRLGHFVENIEKLAVEEGSVVAADAYGDMLMSGVWDTKRMEINRIRDQLEPEGPADPYLILPRDPIKAAKFYQQAADCIEETDAKNRAQAKLAYLQKRGLAGFKKNDKNTLAVKLSEEVKSFLDKNAKNLGSSDSDVESSNFVPLPDVRPLIVDSKTDLFRHLALTMRNRCLLQILIAEVVASLGFLHSFWSNAFLLLGYVTTAISLPLVFFTVVNHYGGYLEGKPVCDCSLIVSAYELSVKHLPQDCRKEGNPFETTPSYIRLSHFIKILFFWFYIVVCAIRFFLLAINLRGNLIWLGNMDSWNPKGVFFITVPINFMILSMIIVFWDKKIALPKFMSSNTETDENQNVDVPISILVSILAEDWDCKRELERITKRPGLHSYIEELEKQNRNFSENNE